MTQSRQATSSEHSGAEELAVRKNRQKPRATVAQSLITGSVAGAIEVFVDHPLWSIKTRLQRGATFTLNPGVLYRGILPNAASMVPITAMQVGLNRCFQNVVFYGSSELSNTQRISSAFVAGIGSAFVSCPTEMVMTYQGQFGGTFYLAIKSLVKEGGWNCLYRGLTATAMREGMFTAFFLAGTPILKAKIQPYCKNDYAVSLMAGLGAGLGATLASQAVDTLKTVQQSARPQQPIGLGEAVKKIYSVHGVYGFFKGGVPRGARVMSAVTIMGLVNDKMEAEFQRYNANKEGVKIRQ